MLQKYSTISVNTCSLLPFIDEFVCKGLISQISIMLFLKNISINSYWYRSTKMLILYPYASLNQILTENVTQSIRNLPEKTWAQKKKKNSYEASFSNKTKFSDFSIFTMWRRATFFEHVYLESNQVSKRIRRTRNLIFYFQY